MKVAEWGRIEQDIGGLHELDENGKSVAVEYEAIRTDASHLRVKRLSPKIIYKKQPVKSKAKVKRQK